MQAILHDKIKIAKAVNVTVIPLKDAPTRLQGLRQGRRGEVRAGSARHALRLKARAAGRCWRSPSLGRGVERLISA